MGNKLFTWLMYIALVLFISAVALLDIQPLLCGDELWEWKLYIRVFLELLLVIAFAVLRIYNSQVQNTRFLIKLKATVDKLLVYLPTIERSHKGLTSALGTHKTSIDADKKAAQHLSDSIEQLTETLKFRRNNGK